MNIVKKISVSSAAIMLLAAASTNAFAGKTERGTVLVDDYNNQVYGDRRYEPYDTDQPRQTPRSIYYYKKGIRFFEEGKLSRAELAFKRSMGGYTHYQQSNAYLGLVNIEQNQHKSAVRYLKRAVKENPDMHALKAALGLSYIEIGRIEKASTILAQLKEQEFGHSERKPEECVLEESIDQLEKALNNT